MSNEDNSNSNNNTLIISPVAKRVVLKPGDSYSSTIKLYSPANASEEIPYRINIRPYSIATDEDYTANLSSATAYNRIMDWIKVDNPEGTVKPNEKTEITYTLDIPEDAEGSGQYLAVAVERVPKQGADSDVQSTIEIASLIYAQIGTPTYNGEILTNTIPSISFVNPIETNFSVKNTGNVHQDVKVTIKAYNLVTGQQMLIDSNLKSDELVEEEVQEFGTSKFNEIVMPETTRTSNHFITGLPSLGIYKIIQEVSFNGETDTKEQITFLCPIWFIALVVFSIALIIAMIFTGLRKKKKIKTTTHKIKS